MTHRCPTCGRENASHAERCVQCGRVFGEDNRCPHCNAIAAVRASGSGYVCVACGKDRPPRPNMTILDRGAPQSSLSATLFRFSGALVLAFAVVMGAAGLWGSISLLTAIATAIASGAIGALAIGQAARLETKTREQRAQRLKQQILELARTRHGDLSATTTAQALRIEIHEADALLTSMADGLHVQVEVDSDGIVHYVFREFAASSPIAVRVDPQLLDDADPMQAEAEDRVERELAKRGRI